MAHQTESDWVRLTSKLSSGVMNRRHLFRLMGVGGMGMLLAACESQGPAGGDTTDGMAGGATPTSDSSEQAAEEQQQEATSEPRMGGTLVVGLDQEPPTMDPHASPSAITFYILASTGESLLFLNEDRELEPWLAESWEVSEDGTSFTFRLRNDVTFQDDTPFNAEAVKWNFDRIVDPNYQAGTALSYISGYTRTDVVDEYTATVKFENAFVPFLTYSAGSPLAMLSPTATQGQGEAVNDTPVLSGPYKVVEWVKRSHITISRWDGYRRRAPWSDHEGPGYLDTVTWRIIPEAGTRVATVESGETQMVTVIPAQDLPRLQSSPDIKIEARPWTGTPRIWLLNVQLPPTDELEVRQAINYAIDRDAIINTVYRGTGTKPISPLTKVMLDDPSLHEYYPFDLDRARELLEQAGWTEGPDGIRQRDGQRLQIILNAIDQGAGPEQAVQLIQGQLREVGIDVQLKVQARPPWYEDNYNGATNGPVMFLRAGDWDGLYSLFHTEHIGTNFNWSRLSDPEIDSLLEQGRTESSTEARREIYLQILQKLNEMAVTVPLADELSVWAMRSNVNGLTFNGYTYPIVADIWLDG